jgi:predicted naringenin-chalcone synthase
MSSPTVLFILNEFLSQYAASRAIDGESERQKHCILLAFGPGLVAEMALLSTAPR